MKSIWTLLDQQPPADLSAEIGALGSVLLDPKRIDDLAGLRPESFYDDANRAIFASMSRLIEAGERIDPVLLKADLISVNRWDIVGAAYLAKVVNGTPNASHAGYYARIVEERWKQRVAIEGALAVARNAERKPEALAADFAALAEQIETGDRTQCVSMAEAVQRAVDRSKLERFGVPTGLIDVDQLTGGLKANQLTILAAATSVGKSAFAIQVADYAAVAGSHVLYVSLEMVAEEIVSERLVRRRLLQDRDTATRQSILSSLHELNYPITFCDRPGLTVGNVRGIARTLKAQGKLDLLVIDHIGLLRETSGKDAYQKMTAISQQLMRLPKELEIPVLALSQVNRENSKHGKGESMVRPRLDNLRDSGSLEQDAHNVWILHRETRYSPDAELIVAKQRNGPVAAIDLHFDADTQTFDCVSATEGSAAEDWTASL